LWASKRSRIVDFVTGFQNDHATSIGKRREFRYANGLGILELDGKI
jgi:hypothetical protein